MSTMRTSVSFKADEEGMFGRQCQSNGCKQYFKIHADDMLDGTITELHCPYCGALDNKTNYLTEGQLGYATSIAAKEVMKKLGAQLKGLEKHSTRGSFISMDIKVKIPDIKIQKYYEKQSRRNIQCDNCGREFSVYGVSFYCPFCGRRGSINVFQENIESINSILSLRETLLEDADLVKSNTVRELEETGVFQEVNQKMLDKAVTSYETYMKSKYVEEMMAIDSSKGIPFYEKRAGNKFQNIDRSHDLLSTDLGFDFKSKLALPDESILNLGLQKRHIIVHNSGIIDDKYCQNTGEPASLVGKRLSISKNDVDVFVKTVTKVVGIIESTV